MIIFGVLCSISLYELYGVRSKNTTMKKFLPAGCIIAVILFAYCNGKPSREADPMKMQADSAQSSKPDTDLAVIHSSFTIVDAHVSTSLAAITKHYLEIK